MMKNPHPAQGRFYVLIAALGLMLLLFLAALYDAQILNGSENRARSIASNATWQTVEASRGILTDTNGKVLVSNRLAYTLTFSKKNFQSDEELNAAIWRLIALCQETDTAWVDTLPISQNSPYLYLSSRDDETFTKFLAKNKLSIQSTSTALLENLRTLFGISDSYTRSQARLIAGIRYELASRESYVFAEDVSTELISQITDGNFAGVTTGQSSIRDYNTTYAAHILGRITRIYAEDWPEYRDKGYSMDALVGESGVEKAFEDWLRGENGTRLVTTDDKGKITGEVYMKEPKPGNIVSLTLNHDLQVATEDTLAATIEGMIDKDSDQRGGAAAVVEVGSGAVLALASYPSFDPSTFAQNYNLLLEDERLPMFNRAVNGTYAPGSTFKMVTAAAALETGVITPSSVIQDKGVYTHDRRKYALRLLAFALLSEIPFNLMNSGAVWDRYHQNVLWTLLTGALVCWLIDWALKNRRALAFVLTALVMAAAFYLLERLNTDYGGWGMLLVVMFYGVHRAPGGAVSKMIAQLFGLTFFSLAAMGGYVSIELWSLVALVPIWLYNGQRGFSPKAVQYGFYAFYPVHILVLSLIAMYRY